jgi:hypothetical protein
LVLLPEPWIEVVRGSDLGGSLLGELSNEVEPGHELSGVTVEPIAKCGGCDDSIFQLGDGTWALVHLTWSGRQETTPFPLTYRVKSEAELRDLMAERAH